jgi:hypothetical protein
VRGPEGLVLVGESVSLDGEGLSLGGEASSLRGEPLSLDGEGPLLSGESLSLAGESPPLNVQTARFSKKSLKAGLNQRFGPNAGLMPLNREAKNPCPSIHFASRRHRVSIH